MIPLLSGSFMRKAMRRGGRAASLATRNGRGGMLRSSHLQLESSHRCEIAG
jgi:hypothetical protein